MSQSNEDKVKEYVSDQEKHHQRVSFAEEWNALLKKHGISLVARRSMCRTTRCRKDVLSLAEVTLVTEASLASRLPWIELNDVGSRLRRIGSHLKSVISQRD